MSVTANLHGVNRAIPNQSNGTTWVTFTAENGSAFTIFMPFEKAEVIAAVFNAPEVNVFAAAPDLLDALDGLQQFFAMADEHSIERFDRLAEQYRRETGKWAPGKSIPDAFNDSTEPEVRRADYDAWVQSKVDAARAAIAKAKGGAA